MYQERGVAGLVSNGIVVAPSSGCHHQRRGVSEEGPRLGAFVATSEPALVAIVDRQRKDCLWMFVIFHASLFLS